MNDQSTTSSDETSDLDAARRDVERAEARLSNRWRAAKLAGEKSVGKALSVARPVLIGAAVVGGVVLLVTSLTRGRRGKVRRFAPAPAGPSLLAEVGRAAALALASAAARRVGESLLHPAPSKSAIASGARG